MVRKEELMEKEHSNVFVIPTNYTDSGKALGGMVETRNLIEGILMLILIGYPELKWIPMSGTVRIVVMTMTLVPIVVVTMMGIDGDSLFQFACHVIKFFRNRRVLHMRRIGGRASVKEDD